MIFFSSDLHLGHENILDYCDRPYSSVEEMDQKLIENWNKKVKKKDRVYFLGDLTLGNPEPYLEQLNGDFTLIRGNHDRKNKWKKLGIEVCDWLDLSIGEFRLLLCHYPLFNQETEYDKSLQKELRKFLDQYDFVVHGHVHDRWKLREKCINVSIDIWDYSPISIEEMIRDVQDELVGVNSNQERFKIPYVELVRPYEEAKEKKCLKCRLGLISPHRNIATKTLKRKESCSLCGQKYYLMG